MCDAQFMDFYKTKPQRNPTKKTNATTKTVKDNTARMPASSCTHIPAICISCYTTWPDRLTMLGSTKNILQGYEKMKSQTYEQYNKGTIKVSVMELWKAREWGEG